MKRCFKSYQEEGFLKSTHDITVTGALVTDCKSIFTLRTSSELGTFRLGSGEGQAALCSFDLSIGVAGI